MSGKRAKREHKYAEKLIELHQDTFQDRYRQVECKHCSRGSTHLQRYSGKRQAKKMARLGLSLEKW